MAVPKLRFKEFQDEWKAEYLSDFTDRVTKKNKDNDCQLPLTISAQYGLVDQTEFFNKTVASKNLEGYYLLSNGEFAYNKSYSNGYPFGAIKRLDRYEKGVLSTLYICFKPKSNINSDFLTHYFETNKWHTEVSMIAVEGARNHGLLNIPIAEFFDTQHTLPRDEQEQQKIADFLSLLDRKIALQEKKIALLKDYKKGVFESISNSMQVEYKLRLDSVTKIIKGQQLNKIDMVSNGDYYVLNGGITPSGYTTHYNTEAQTISISEGGNSCGFVNYNTSPFWSGGHCYTLTSTSNEHYKYIYYYLKHFEQSLMAMRVGSGLPNIQKKDLSAFEIDFPNTKMQTIIANAMSNVEIVERNAVAKLNLLMNLKTALLQQMFI